jgi:hypothetical protein
VIDAPGMSDARRHFKELGDSHLSTAGFKGKLTKRGNGMSASAGSRVNRGFKNSNGGSCA